MDQILRDTADNIGSSFFFGDGRVNANSAVLAAGSPPPPLDDPVLLGLDPNVAGQTNSITVTDAPPGSTVFFEYSLNTGTSVISGGTCNGQTLDLDNAIMLTSIVADPTGTAIFNVFVPLEFVGITVHLQAYAETGSTCGVTNRVTQTIQ